MGLQHVVLDRVAVLVEDDAVDGIQARRLPQEDRRGDLIGLDQPQVELHGESTRGLATSMAKTSPDSARAIRMVRSFSGSPMASAHRA